MDSVKDYARQWDKHEKEDIKYSFQMDEECEVVDANKNYKKNLNGSMNTHAISIFKDSNVAKHIYHLHDKYVVVPSDKAPNAPTTSSLCINHIQTA